MEYLSGRALYQRVIRDTVAHARRAVWIATANLKEMLVEAPVGTRARAAGKFIPALELLGMLASRGAEVRLLHAGIPSSAFSRTLVKHRDLVRPGARNTAAPVELRRCPRVHMKAIVVDGASVYLGSANWTGAGLGAKGDGRRNFEIGFLSNDDLLIDDVQGLFDEVWSGRACGSCRMRDLCPAPIAETLEARRPL